jgi:hypothetical protein
MGYSELVSWCSPHIGSTGYLVVEPSSTAAPDTDEIVEGFADHPVEGDSRARVRRASCRRVRQRTQRGSSGECSNGVAESTKGRLGLAGHPLCHPLERVHAPAPMVNVALPWKRERLRIWPRPGMGVQAPLVVAMRHLVP